MTKEELDNINDRINGVGLDNVENIIVFTKCATNGDALQFLFPDIEVGEEGITDLRVMFPWAASWENVDKDWWYSKVKWRKKT